MDKALVGVIGGSGLNAMEALEDVQELQIDTPFGAPSDAVMTGRVDGVAVAFLARHGRGHRLIPSEIPYRANVYALKTLGVRYLISLSAVGSLRQDLRPLDMVLPDQFIDLTRRRESTFFGSGGAGPCRGRGQLGQCIGRAGSNVAENRRIILPGHSGIVLGPAGHVSSVERGVHKIKHMAKVLPLIVGIDGDDFRGVAAAGERGIRGARP